MRRLENKKGGLFLLFACPNVVDQGVGVIAQLVGENENHALFLCL